MTTTVKNIKRKVQSLPLLSLPIEKGKYKINTDASQETWGCVLLEEIEGKEEICVYASGNFRREKINYPSSHKELIATKKTILHLKLYINPIKFTIRIDLKILARMFKKIIFLTDNHNRLSKWVIWLDKFDFDIVHKTRCLNFIADMFSKEDHNKNDMSLFMLSNAEMKKVKEEDFKCRKQFVLFAPKSSEKITWTISLSEK